MKSYKNLYPPLYSFAALYAAWQQARLGKRQRVAVASFEFDLENNLFQLSDELRQEHYRPGPYTNFYIYEPKKRLVSAAPFRDRVVHHALCHVIEPIWESRFIHTSFACRLGKGSHKALDCCQRWLNQYPYAFQGDIVKYFPSIDHQILFDLLAHHIADPKVLALIRLILETGKGIQANEIAPVYFPGDDLFAILRPRGLPIGNLTSQFWANVYLHQLDMFVKHQLHCRAYLRYMDDFILFSHDKTQLHEWHEAIREFLASRLRLLLHPLKSVVYPVRIGVDFCGFRLFSSHRRLRRTSIRRFVRRFRRQRTAYWQGELSYEQMTISVRSWIAHAAHGDTWRLREHIFNDYPF